MAASIPNVVAPFKDIELPLGGRRSGKVRVSFELPDHRRLLITTDRLSALDRVVAAVPFKGQVLNQLAAWWFSKTRHIIDNHLISIPDPNALIAIDVAPLPVEVVVRGAITGNTSTSLWKQYADGERVIYGHTLPDGLQRDTLLPTALITPTTKGEAGAHDEPLSVDDVVIRGLVEPEMWERVKSAALALFAFGQKVAGDAGLILADTKYEFGLDRDGKLLLIDEMHTPDSSRFWEKSSYEARLAAGEDPESLDKEPIRRALARTGYTGDGAPPDLGAEVVAETTRRYIKAYERITGEEFVPGDYPVEERVVAALKSEGVL